ncbi:hypothetical protein ACH5RR_000127 [Cinchona calisaya]|uniref:Uncharacterized protein n=1 Tax=Cinchona calisaya TaxID=153742 RepID=A0ABD3AZY6_9GENT
MQCLESDSSLVEIIHFARLGIWDMVPKVVKLSAPTFSFCWDVRMGYSYCNSMHLNMNIPICHFGNKIQSPLAFSSLLNASTNSNLSSNGQQIAMSMVPSSLENEFLTVFSE